MKKAVVFPINYDNREIIQYSSLIEDYTIVLGIVLEKFSDDTFPDDKVLRYSDLEIESIEWICGDPCCQIPQTGYGTYLHPCSLIQSHQQQADHIRHRLTALPDSCPAFQPWIIVYQLACFYISGCFELAQGTDT